MMHPRQLILTVLLTAIAVFMVILLSLNRQQSTSDIGNHTSSKSTSSKPPDHSSTTLTKGIRAPRQSGVSARSIPEISESASLPASDFRDSKADRIAQLYDELRTKGVRVTGPVPEEIAIETEGMDTLSAARHLREFGVFEYALEYAERTVAENPESFDAVLLWAQLLHPRQHKEVKEIAFRLGLEMNPDSIEVLVGLGQTLSRGSQPWEAIPYLEEAIQRDSSVGHAYYALAGSYEKSGLYDEALATYKKTYELTQDPVALRHIQAIEAGNPIFKPLPSEAQELGSKELPPEGTLPQVPPQEETPPIPNKTEELERESTFDDEPLEEPSSRVNSEASAAEQREIEEFLRMLDEYETSIGSESDPSTTVKGRIADLERSIESKPNQRSII
jgi:tetratricopeptide (TPR) repeat protein